MKEQIKLRGLFHVKQIRDGKVLKEFDSENLATYVGRNMMLAAMFTSGSQSANWYLGLINNSPSPSLVATDTMASHAGWVETVLYTQTTRQQWTGNTVSNGTMTNSTYVSFTMNNTVTLYGCFCCDNSTLNGTSGTLYGEAQFSSPLAVLSGDIIQITYSVQLN